MAVAPRIRGRCCSASARGQRNSTRVVNGSTTFAVTVRHHPASSPSAILVPASSALAPSSVTLAKGQRLAVTGRQGIYGCEPVKGIQARRRWCSQRRRAASPAAGSDDAWDDGDGGDSSGPEAARARNSRILAPDGRDFILRSESFDDYSCVNVATALRVLARSGEAGEGEAVCALSKQFAQRVASYRPGSLAASLAALARLGVLRDVDGVENILSNVRGRARAGELGAREITAVARAVADFDAVDDVMDELARQLSTQAVEFRSFDLVNSLCTLSRWGPCHSAALEAAAEEVSRRCGQLNGGQLAAVAWTYAKAGRSDNAVFGAVARHLRSMGPALAPRDMAIAVWAFAKVGVRNAKLMDTLGRLLSGQAALLSARDVANVAWGYGTLGVGHVALFRALARRASSQPESFVEGRDLATLVWGFNRAPGVSAPPELLAALTEPMLTALPTMSAQEVAMTASGYAEGGQQEEARLVLEGIDHEVLRRGEELPSLELATITRAFSTARRCPPTVFHAVATQLPGRAEVCDPSHLATVLWAFAKSSYKPEEAQLVDSLAETIEVRSEEFGEKELATVCWALARIQPADGSVGLLSLCRAVETRLDSRRSDFSTMDMHMLCDGFRAARHRLPLACTQFLAQQEARQQERKQRRMQQFRKKATKKATYKQKGLSR